MRWIDPDCLAETSGVVDLYLLDAGGVLRQVLHGPRGEVRGLLRGDGFTTEHGTAVAVREIGSSRDDLRRIGAMDDKGG